jgi:hypothetical protein
MAGKEVRKEGRKEGKQECGLLLIVCVCALFFFRIHRMKADCFAQSKQLYHLPSCLMTGRTKNFQDVL